MYNCNLNGVIYKHGLVVIFIYLAIISADDLGPILLTWFNLNPCIEK